MRGFYMGIMMLVAFGLWLALVLNSFREHHGETYKFFARTNERRWVCLLILTVSFFFVCSSVVGRGQPLIRGVTEGLSNTVAAPARGVGDILKGIFENQIPDEWKSKPFAGPPPPPEPRSPFYGIASWSHWIVFVLLYLPTLLIYGLFARREELVAWAEERLRTRPARRQRQQQVPPPVPGTPVHRLGGRFYWLEAGLDVVAEILGHVLSTRFFTPRS